MAEPNDQFAVLEEKMVRAIDLFKRTQVEKRALEQEIQKLKDDAKGKVHDTAAMERELISLRRDREEVRSRVEKLLERIDALTGPESEASSS